MPVCAGAAAWPPYAWLRRAICERVAGYVRTHDAPGEPYAVCRFNRNKPDGLVQLYRRMSIKVLQGGLGQFIN